MRSMAYLMFARFLADYKNYGGAGKFETVLDSIEEVKDAARACIDADVRFTVNSLTIKIW